MIPSKKCDRVATFQKIARVKSRVIEMEGNLGDDPSNRSIFILKILINKSENSIHIDKFMPTHPICQSFPHFLKVKLNCPFRLPSTPQKATMYLFCFSFGGFLKS